MERRIIFRVEHPKDGKGLFKSSVLDKYRDSMLYYHLHDIYFPTPSDEGLNRDKEGKEWFCAYNSFDNLKDWLDEYDFKYLIKLGFNIMQIEVKEFQEGENQTLFTKESIINSINITSQFYPK